MSDPGRGLRVVSVDCKKKELIGEFKNGGREWQPKGEPVRVNIHDFVSEQGKAIPYGVYDVERNVGWVNVGQDHETAAFAVESLRRWWRGDGSLAYPDADQLLICADGGGGNGYRVRAWKHELWRFAQEADLAITVCHLPPGTSKWNKIEHRLFSHISMNWRGRPLTSYEVIVELIAATTSKTGLSVHAERDHGTYPTKVLIDDARMDPSASSRITSTASGTTPWHPVPEWSTRPDYCAERPYRSGPGTWLESIPGYPFGSASRPASSFVTPKTPLPSSAGPARAAWAGPRLHPG